MKISSLVAVAIFWMISAASASAETMTGCLHPGGVLIKLAVGADPSIPCTNNQIQVTINFTSPPPTPLGAMCSAILAADPSATDGVYTIDPDETGGSEPFDAYCDMTTDGGGWTVVFQSDDPSGWGSDFGAPGTGQWGHDFSGFNFSMNEVLLIDIAGNRAKRVTGISSSDLYGCKEGTNSFWWNGALFFADQAFHLGVHTSEPDNNTVGYVIVSIFTNPSRPGCEGLPDTGHVGWGFGHLNFLDNAQGWGWDSTNMGPTVFAIGVR